MNGKVVFVKLFLSVYISWKELYDYVNENKKIRDYE